MTAAQTVREDVSVAEETEVRSGHSPEPEVRPHISHTQVSMFTECSLQWWFRYILKIRKRQTINMAVGDVIHQVLAMNFRQKAFTGADLEAGDILDRFSALLDLKVIEGVDILGTRPIGTYKDAGLAVLENYVRTMAPEMLPRMVQLDEMAEPVPAVELELRRRIPETDVDMLGYLDLWLEGGPIVDYKIHSRKWGKDGDGRKRQALAYCMMIGTPEPMVFHICVRDALKPVIQPVEAVFSQDDVDRYIRHLWDVLNEMELLREGKIEPRTKDGYCNEMLCRHYYECQDYKMGMFDPGEYQAEGNEAMARCQGR